MPFPAGGGTDLLARLIAEALSKKWGQTVIVENLSGAASGNVGSSEVARSDAGRLHAAAQPAGPDRDEQAALQDHAVRLVEVGADLGGGERSLCAGGAQRPRRVGCEELVEKAKANPAKITYASPGAGTVGHLAAKQFEMLAGIELVTVPYKGLAPALKDIVGGHVDLIFDTGTTSLPLHTSKQVSIIATGSAERWPSLPEVPTIAEAGLPGFRAVTWYAIVAPPDTPAAVADKISKDVAEVVNSPAIAESIRSKLKMDPIGSSSSEAAKLFADDAKLWAKVIQEAKVSLD